VATFLGCLWIIASPAHALGQGGAKPNTEARDPVLSTNGRYLAFSSQATNLSQDDSVPGNDVYVRDLDLGVTDLVSRANGFSGVKQNCQAGSPSVSDDGRFVAFTACGNNVSPADPDTFDDVYVRDVLNGTTTLVSRATGASGAKGNHNALNPSISGDGRFVAFHSQATNLDPADTDSLRDIFVRDLQTDTTTLVSRGTGLAGAKSNGESALPAISDDGNLVAFRSTATNLPGDTDAANDIFLRDIQAGTTLLVSRADGAAGANSALDSFTASISGNGRYIAFGTNAVNFDPVDADSNTDVYLRDVQSSTTTLVSRASGPTGAKGNALSTQRGMVSDDGRFVAFNSRSTNLTPDDPDSLMDVFVRDVQSATTELVSRASGVTGPKGNGASSDFLDRSAAISGDGRFVAFNSEATNLDPDDTDTSTHIYVRDRQDAITELESRGTPSFPRPTFASPVRLSLVTAMAQCAAPNRTHGPPISASACAPPAQLSPYLTIGTPDANGKPVNATGVIRYSVILGDVTTTADEADVRIGVSITDVRVRSTLDDYAGEVAAASNLRVTDKHNGNSLAEDATLQDRSLSVTVPCAVTASTTIGSTCAITTTADTLVPGSVVERKRAVWQLGQAQVLDGGSDNVVSTAADNRRFMVQGYMVP
jgi:hypothetical protein